MINIKRTLIFSFIVIFMMCCNCSVITCPEFDSQYEDWLPSHKGDSIKYRNNNNDKIVFVVSDYDFKTQKTLECYKTELGGCHCPDCPTPEAHSRAQTNDTSRYITSPNGYNFGFFVNMGTYLSKDKSDADTVRLLYGLMDSQNEFVISPVLRLNGNDSLLANFTAGLRTYSNVVVHHVDTSIHNQPNSIYDVYFIKDSYYTKEYGVVGFYDLKTHSFFYREF